MKLEHRNLAFEVRSSSADGSEFSGYASTFFKIDDYGSMFARTAFDDTLDFFLAKGFIGGLDHNWAQPIGKPIEAKTDATGLYSTARISDTAHGRDVRELIKDKVISQLSIGFVTLGYEWLDTQADVEDYWASNSYTPDDEDKVRCRYGAMVKTKVRLYEFSPVTVPANSACMIDEVRGALGSRDHVLALLGSNADEVALLEHAAIDADTHAAILRLRSICDGVLSRQAPVMTSTGAVSGQERRLRGVQLAEIEASLLMAGITL